MNKTLLLAGVAACLFAANANAVELKQYVSGKLTYSDMSNDVKYTEEDGGAKEKADDNVLGGSFAYGIKAGAVRTELELNIHEDAEKKYTEDGESWKNSLENNSIMLNAYYDIDTGTKFTPYVGAGVGYAKIKGKLKSPVLSDDMSDTNFAWQVGAGVGYELTENVTMDAGYRYADYGDFSEYESKLDVSAHEFYVGARYTF